MTRLGPLPLFSLLLLGAGALLPAGARGQQPPKLHRIGVLTPALAANAPMVEGLKTGLKQADLVDGRDVTYVVRFTRGHEPALGAAAEELVRDPASVAAQKKAQEVAAKLGIEGADQVIE